METIKQFQHGEWEVTFQPHPNPHLMRVLLNTEEEAQEHEVFHPEGKQGLEYWCPDSLILEIRYMPNPEGFIEELKAAAERHCSHLPARLPTGQAERREPMVATA